MDTKKQLLWVTRTGIMLALLIVLQTAAASTGNVILTGSIVNMMLIISVMVCGYTSGLTVAVTSPVLAKLLGIGPLWEIIPFILLGNIVLATLWHVIGNRQMGSRKSTALVVALIIAGVGKFLTLYITIVRIAIPFFLQLPPPQAVVISNMFSLQQLLTASIGGAVAVLLVSRLKKAIAGGGD